MDLNEAILNVESRWADAAARYMRVKKVRILREPEYIDEILSGEFVLQLHGPNLQILIPLKGRGSRFCGGKGKFR